jgi:multidrug efflux system membrane fusion protein
MRYSSGMQNWNAPSLLILFKYIFPAMKNLVYCAIVPVFLLFASCGQKKEMPAAGKESKVVTARIEVAVVLEQEIAFPVRATGLVISKNEAKPSFKVGGVIKRTFADAGDNVFKGMLLATLDMSEINAQVAQAENGLEKARRDLQRARNLLADSAATLEQVQNAETAFRLAEETRAIVVFNRQYAEVRAPINGKVVQRLSREGEITGPGMPVFYIVGTGSSDWRIKAGVTDRDWVRVRVGNPVVLQFDAFPGEEFRGEVSEIAQTVNPQSGTFDVEVQLNGKPPRLAAGMVAALEIQPRTEGADLVIPVDALIEADGETGAVFLIDDSLRAVRRPVRIKAITQQGILLKSGLKAGDRVATTGGAFLQQGSKVSIIE